MVCKIVTVQLVVTIYNFNNNNNARTKCGIGELHNKSKWQIMFVTHT